MSVVVLSIVNFVVCTVRVAECTYGSRLHPDSDPSDCCNSNIAGRYISLHCGVFGTLYQDMVI